MTNSRNDDTIHSAREGRRGREKGGSIGRTNDTDRHVRRLRRDHELENALSRPSSFRAWHVSEPRILVGAANPSADPKLGLSIYGPWKTVDDPGQRQIRIGIIGTGETISSAQNWLGRCRNRVDPAPGDDADPYLYPSFPGLESADGFRCQLDLPAALVEKLTEIEIARCTRASTRDEAVESIGHVLRERLQALSERESPPQVVLVALPQEVRDVAGTGRNRPKRKPIQRENRQLMLAFMDPKPLEPFSPSRTLHRVVKAEGMRANLPTQLIWPGSLEGSDDVQDDATRAWNLCTALYYKAGGVPWRVEGLARNTCYVGISFFQPIDAIGELQASMAQAFSDRNEGTVLRGTRFRWDRTQGPPRLSREGARELLEGVLRMYELHHHQKPARVVVHKSSAYSEDELGGLKEALSDISYYDLLSVSPSSVRFLRVGKEPPVRGTVIQIGTGRYIMYTRGYVPYLKLYPGLRIPRPLQFVHAAGSGGIQELMREVLSLTRMNWNSADFASAEPITLAFSRNVGLILSELPVDVQPHSSFRFYM